MRRLLALLMTFVISLGLALTVATPVHADHVDNPGQTPMEP
jgi:hypothetical protein